MDGVSKNTGRDSGVDAERVLSWVTSCASIRTSCTCRDLFICSPPIHDLNVYAGVTALLVKGGKRIGPLVKSGFAILLTGFVFTLFGSLNNLLNLSLFDQFRLIEFLLSHVTAIMSFTTLLSVYLLISRFKSGVDNPTIPRWRELIRGFVAFIVLCAVFTILKLPSISDVLGGYVEDFVEASFRWFSLSIHYIIVVFLVLIGQASILIGNSLWTGGRDLQHHEYQDRTGWHSAGYHEVSDWKLLLPAILLLSMMGLIGLVMGLIGLLLWIFHC